MMLWLATVGVKQWRSRVPVARWMRCLSVLDAGEVDMTGRRGLLLALLKGVFSCLCVSFFVLKGLAA